MTDNKTAIVVALIGVFGTISAAIFANWDKLTGSENNPQQQDDPSQQANDDSHGGETGGNNAPAEEAQTTVVDSCFYFQNGSFEFVLTTPELREKQLNYVRNLIAAYGNITVQGVADPGMDRVLGLRLASRRAERVRAYLISTGLAADRIMTVSYGKENPAVDTLPTDAFEAAYCLARVMPGSSG